MSTESMPIQRLPRQAGVTLVELIVAIVIVSVALGGLMAVYNRAGTASADPLVTQQMLAIAEAMMEEVLQKPFAVDSTAAPSRAFYNDVRDYAAYGPVAVSDVNGGAIAGLERYRVAVRVDESALTGVPAAQALRVRVTVSDPETKATDIVLTGWRTQP